jgi:electron transport complex protein RnfD
VYQFGIKAAILLLVGVVSCVFFEWAVRKILGRRSSIGDLSAVVTGLLISMNLPSTVPFWLPIVGSFVAIVVVKQLFGGIGKNFLNPALAARVFLFLSWSDQMATFTAPRWMGGVVDTATYATTKGENNGFF